jgi:hypothetical protein
MAHSDVHAHRPQGFQIEFSENLTADQRAAAERSVAAHIAHVADARAPQRAARAALAESTAAIHAPLVRLVEADPAAAKSLAEASDRRRDLMHLLDVDLPAVPRTRDLPLGIVPLADNGVADQFFVLPYHFTWQWHRGASGDSTADRNTGEVSVGTTVDDDEFSDVHAGVGVFMSSTSARPVVARSLRTSSESYTVAAGGFGGDALAEGGMEMTLVEDGQLRSSGQDKRFRKRLSNGEAEQWDSGGFGVGNDIEVAVQMVPGRGYTLNVGAWVYAEQHGGFGIGGDSWAVTKMSAKVILMSLFDQ